MPYDDNFLRTQQFVKHLLINATEFDWTLQGLGMLRLHLTREVRLHVWDSRYRVPNVSVTHNHPWSFRSCVVAGSIRQIRFTPVVARLGKTSVARYHSGLVRCGLGGGLATYLEDVLLDEGVPEGYGPGDEYEQLFEEIHASDPLDGTVTIVTRTFNKDTEHAHVFWPLGTGWVSAEPRQATQEEIRHITSTALALWFR